MSRGPGGRRRQPAALAAAASLALALGAEAGGPLISDADGEPVGWAVDAAVPIHPDQGGLGLLSNAEAIALTFQAIGRWQDVDTAALTYQQAAALATDVDETNFGSFLGPFGGIFTPLGQNPVVFDEDGQIFDALFGVGTSVLGFASPTFFSDGETVVAIGDLVPPGSNVVEGLAFLNGKFVDGIDDPPTNREVSLLELEAVMVHELGHFSGLDHTQIHGLKRPPETDLCGFTTPIETMFPILRSSGQRFPQRDDQVALSALYPTGDFETTRGCVAGVIRDQDGLPAVGINVIATNVAAGNDAVSTVSAPFLFGTGSYRICGLFPGSDYRIGVQEIDAMFQGGSSVGPYSPPRILPGPPELYSGAQESADPAVDPAASFEAVSVSAGATVEGLDVVLNRQDFEVDNVARPGDGPPFDFATGDFDRDGTLDFVATQWGFDPGNLLQFYRGLGGGFFASPALIDDFPGNYHLVAGSFNPGEDDFLDIAVASPSRVEVRVYWGDGSGGFDPPSTLFSSPAAGFSDTILVGGQFDQGGSVADLAFLVGEDDGSVTVHTFLGDPGGTFDLVDTSIGAGAGLLLSWQRRARTADFAGNGLDDILFVNATGPALGLLTATGQGGFSASLVPLDDVLAFNASSGLAVGDFDRDGHSDAVVAGIPGGTNNNCTRTWLHILLGDGQGGFQASASYWVPEVFQMAQETADFDRDGHLDVVSGGGYGLPGDPGAKVSIAFGDGQGGVREVRTIWGLAELPALFPTQITAADFDGDRLPDVLVGIENSHFKYSLLTNEQTLLLFADGFESGDTSRWSAP